MRFFLYLRFVFLFLKGIVAGKWWFWLILLLCLWLPLTIALGLFVVLVFSLRVGFFSVLSPGALLWISDGPLYIVVAILFLLRFFSRFRVIFFRELCGYFDWNFVMIHLDIPNWIFVWFLFCIGFKFGFLWWIDFELIFTSFLWWNGLDLSFIFMDIINLPFCELEQVSIYLQLGFLTDSCRSLMMNVYIIRWIFWLTWYFDIFHLFFVQVQEMELWNFRIQR